MVLIFLSFLLSVINSIFLIIEIKKVKLELKQIKEENDKYINFINDYERSEYKLKGKENE